MAEGRQGWLLKEHPGAGVMDAAAHSATGGLAQEGRVDLVGGERDIAGRKGKGGQKKTCLEQPLKWSLDIQFS